MAFEKYVVRVGTDLKGFKSGMDKAVAIGKRTAKRMALAFVATGTASAVIGAKFEQTLTETATVAQAFGKDLKDLEDKARKLGKTTAFTATQAAGGMYDLASAGMNTKEIIDATEYSMKLAGATGSEMAQATRLVASTLKQFGMDASETKRITDTFAAAITSSQLTMERLTEAMKYAGTTGASLGWSIEETTGAVAQFANLGLEGSQAGTNLRMAMIQLMKGTNKAKGALAEMGLELADVNPETHTFGELLQTLGERAMSGEQAIKIFGARSGMNMKMLSQIAAEGVSDFKGFVDMLQESQKGVGRTSEMYDRMMNTFRGQWKIMLSALQELGISFFDTYKLKGKELFTTLAMGIVTFADTVKKHADTIWAMIDALITMGKIVAVGGPVYIAFTQYAIIVGLASKAVLAFRMSLLTAHAASIAVVGGLTLLKASVLGLFAAFAGYSIGTWMYKNFETARLAGLAFVDATVEAFIYWKSVGKLVWAALKTGFDGMIGTIRESWISFLEKIASGVEKFPGIGKKIATALKGSIKLLKDNTKFGKTYAELSKEINKEKDKEIKTHRKTIDEIREGHQTKIELLEKHERAVKKSAENRLKAEQEALKEKLETAVYYQDKERDIVRNTQQRIDESNRNSVSNYLGYLKEKTEADEKAAEIAVKAKEDEAAAQKLVNNALLESKKGVEKYEKQLILSSNTMSESIKGLGLGARDAIKGFKTWGETFHTIGKDFTIGTRDVLSGGLRSLIKGDMADFQSAWESLWNSLLKTVTDKVAEMIVQATIVAGIDWISNAVSGWFSHEGTWKVPGAPGTELPVTVEAGQMILPKGLAEKIRDQAGAGNEFQGLMAAIDAQAGARGMNADEIKDLVKGTLTSHGTLVGQGTALLSTGKINATQFLTGVLHPGALISSIISGGVPEVMKQQMGWTSMPADWGSIVTALAGSLFMGPIGAIVGNIMGAGFGEWIGDALNLRANELELDRLEDLGFSRSDAKDIVDRVSGTGIGMPAGGHDRSDHEDVGQGGMDVGETGGTRGGRAYGGPVSAGGSYTVGELGEEKFTPIEDGYITPGSGGITINAPLVHIEGNLVADESTFNDFVEEINDRLYKLAELGY